MISTNVTNYVDCLHFTFLQPMYWYILAAHIFSCLTFIGDLRCSKMYLHFRKRLLRGKERVLLLRWAAAHGWWMILAATRVSELFSAQMCCYGFRKILRSRSSYCCCCCKMCLLSLSAAAAAAISSSYIQHYSAVVYITLLEKQSIVVLLRFT